MSGDAWSAKASNQISLTHIHTHARTHCSYTMNMNYLTISAYLVLVGLQIIMFLVAKVAKSKYLYLHLGLRTVARWLKHMTSAKPDPLFRNTSVSVPLGRSDP